MATDSDFDSCEFDKISKVIRHFPPENGLIKYSSEGSSFCETKKYTRPSNKIGDCNYDHSSTSSKSGTEIRYINPMIYPEILKNENCGDHAGKSSEYQFCHSRHSATESKQGPNALTDGISLLSIVSHQFFDMFIIFL